MMTLLRQGGEYIKAAAILHFKCNEKFPTLKEATVRGWKNAHCKELLLQSSRKHEPVEIEELPQNVEEGLFYWERSWKMR